MLRFYNARERREMNRFNLSSEKVGLLNIFDTIQDAKHTFFLIACEGIKGR